MRTYKSKLDHFNQLLIVLSNGCWILYTRPKHNGYSRFSHRGENIIAHIFAYEHFIGPIPINHDLHHKCRCKRCCNPYHVEPLTRREHILQEPRHILFSRLNKKRERTEDAAKEIKSELDLVV